MSLNFDAAAVHGWLLTLFLVTGNFAYAFPALVWAVVSVLLGMFR